MTSITVSDALYPKVVAFKEVIEAVLGEHIAFDAYVELVLEEGIEAVLRDVLGLSDHQALVTLFYEMSTRYPAHVFSHLAEQITVGELPAGGHRTNDRKLGSLIIRNRSGTGCSR